MTNHVVIYHAQAGDAALLHQLLLRAFSEYDGRLDPPSGANDETVESIALRLGEGGALICNVNDLAVGCLFYAPKSDHLYVGRLSVPPEHRKRGIGDRLLRTAEQHAVALGLPSVRLRVRLVLETLHAYYAARGYRPIGLHSHQGYTHPTFVEMEKRL